MMSSQGSRQVGHDEESREKTAVRHVGEPEKPVSMEPNNQSRISPSSVTYLTKF